MGPSCGGPQGLLWVVIGQMDTHTSSILEESVSASIGTCRRPPPDPKSNLLKYRLFVVCTGDEDFALPVMMKEHF